MVSPFFLNEIGGVAEHNGVGKLEAGLNWDPSLQGVGTRS